MRTPIVYALRPTIFDRHILAFDIAGLPRSTILGKISKRGNKYLRTLFVQAAHVVLARRPNAAMRGLWPWIEQASKRLHRNMLAIALANKLARITWAVLARGRPYQPRIIADAA